MLTLSLALQTPAVKGHACEWVHMFEGRVSWIDCLQTLPPALQILTAEGPD